MSGSTSTNTGDFAPVALRKVVGTDSSKYSNTTAFCINRDGELIDEQFSKQPGLLSCIIDGLMFILSPAHLIVIVLLFYADLWISIPVRLVIGSVLVYQQIIASQHLEAARVRYESAYEEAVHDDLKNKNGGESEIDDNKLSDAASSKRGAPQVTPLHRAGMKLMDCTIDVLSAKLNAPEQNKESGGTSVNLTFHMKMTHKPTNAKWHIWRQYSDFTYIRHAISLEFIADHNPDVISASRNPSATSIDDGEGHSSGGSGHKTSIVSRLIKGNSQAKLQQSKDNHNSTSVHIVSGGSKISVDLPSLPLPLSSPTNVPPHSAEYLAEFARRRQMQVWGWLLQMQEIAPFANHPFFREFLGMPEYDASIVIPCLLVDNGDGEKGSTSTAVTKPKTFVGTTLDEFRFLDANPAFKYMFKSCRDTHGIPARGRTYMTDKKKVNPGRAICELILMEVYEVPARDKADRVDHIASRGQVKRRLEALKTLTDNPFIFILNFQLPGDPPISIVSYYALPSDYLERNKDMENIKGFGSLVDRFIDLPRTEDERLAAWGVGPLAGQPPTARQSSAADSKPPTQHTSEDKMGTHNPPRPAQRPSISATTPTRAVPGDILSSDDEDNHPNEHKKYKLYDCFPHNDHGHGHGHGHGRGGVQRAASSSAVADSAAAHPTSSAQRDGVLKKTTSTGASPKPKSKGIWGMFGGSGSGASSAGAHEHTASPDGDSSGTWRESGIAGGDTKREVGHTSASAATTETETAAATATPAPAPTPTPAPAPVPAAAKKPAPVVSKSKSSWNVSVPSDITWPDPENPDQGTLPQSDFRNQRFKLVPLMLEGPWVVLAAVKSQPALLGRKVVQRYYRGANYMEIDVYVGSSIIASQIVGICRGYGKHFTCNIGIMIQGESEAELPERMLAVLTQNKVDLDHRIQLEEDD